MSFIPGPRTSPTIKPTAVMTKPKPWQLALSPAHLVILLGLITGSMAGAFYLGFTSGQHAGYESGLQATLGNMARLPVPTEELDPAAASQPSVDVYAKLTEGMGRNESAPNASPGARGEEIPELGIIESTESLPILPEAPLPEGALPGSLGSGATDTASKKGSNTALRADEADSKSPSGATATLGSLAEEGSTVTKQADSNKPEKSLNSVADLNTLPNPLTTNSDKIPETPQNLNIQGQGGNIEQVLDTEKTRPAKATAKLTQEQSSSTPAVSKEGEISVRAKIPTGWYVQVAAPRKVQDATEIAKKLQRSGIPVMIESAQVRGEDYFRVVAGPQAQRAGAEKLLTQIKSKGSVKGDPFVRAVR